MQRTCARVANWFRLSKTSTSVDFGIDLAIAIAAESVRNCFGVDAVKENVN